MDTNKQYKIELFKILGLAFLSPIGKLLVNVPEIGIKGINAKFYVSFVLFSIIALVGIILLLKGYELTKKDIR